MNITGCAILGCNCRSPTNNTSAQTQPSLTAHDTMTLRAVASDESLSGFVRLALYEVLVKHLAPAGVR